MSYVIIGNSTAAVGAVEGIRKYDRQTPIVIISDEPYHTYARPLISYYLGGRVTEDKLHYRCMDFYEQNNIRTILGVKAEAIDTQNRKVILQEGGSIPYNKLLVATGGKAIVPAIKGLDKENVFSFTKLDDVKAIKKAAVKGSRAIVVGASFSGLKAVEALVQRDVEVTVIDIMDRIMPRLFDKTASSLAEKTLEENGVNILLSTTVQSITGAQKAAGVLLKDGKELPGDFIILAIGVRCNTDIVKDTEIKTNRGIIVDETMRTNIPGVYAAGDVAEGYNFIEDKNMEIAIIPNAYRQGETAGANMSGQNLRFDRGFIMNSMPLLGLSILSAGISEEKEGIKIKTAYAPERNSYKKFYIADGCLVGYLLMNDIDRAGLYTGFIRNKTDISAFEDSLGGDNFGLISIPEDMRKSIMLDKKRR
jgi:NAD(P)H-nitrite reductase large subunit